MLLGEDLNETQRADLVQAAERQVVLLEGSPNSLSKLFSMPWAG